MADRKELDFDELDNVVGGNIAQMEDDSQNFKRLGVLSGNVNDRDKMAISAAFNAYGISVEQHGGYAGKDNKYFMNGQEIPRDVAWFHVQSQWNQGNRPHVI